MVARCDELGIGIPEHLPEMDSGPKGRNPRREVDYTALGKQLNDLVVQPVVNEVGITMDEIDDLVLVDQPPKCGPHPHRP